MKSNVCEYEWAEDNTSNDLCFVVATGKAKALKARKTVLKGVHTKVKKGQKIITFPLPQDSACSKNA